MAATERSPEVCGAAGCRATTGLVRVETKYGVRVLCDSCRSDMA